MRRFGLLLLVVGVTAGLIAVAMTAGRKSYHSGVYLFGDQGVTMLAAQEILGGRMLYREVALPYGPAPTYAYAGMASLFGNHIDTYLMFHAAFSLLFVGLTYSSLSRFYPPWLSAAGVLLIVVPLAIAPGTILGSSLHAAYTTPEKCLLAGLTLVWSAPARRPFRRGAAIGLVLGGWQFVKFGGGAFAGAAVLLIDLLCLTAEGAGRRAWQRWLIAGVGTVLAVAGCESVRCAAAFAFLPSDIARDVIWPAYTKALYDAFPAETRYPSWVGVRYFVVQQLPVLVGGALALLLAWRILKSRRGAVEPSRDDEPAVLVPAAFYLVGSFAYFGHVFVFMHYAWCLAWAVPALVSRARWPARAGVVAVYAPLVLVTLRAAARPAVSADVVPVPLPTGDVIYANPQEREMILAAKRGVDLARSRAEGPVLVYPTGAGFDWAFNVPRFSRDTWHLPHYIRPYDEPVLVAAVDNLAGVVVLDSPYYGRRKGSGVDRLRADRAFSPAVVERIEQRFPVSVTVSDSCEVLLPCAAPSRER